MKARDPAVFWSPALGAGLIAGACAAALVPGAGGSAGPLPAAPERLRLFHAQPAGAPGQAGDCGPDLACTLRMDGDAGQALAHWHVGRAARGIAAESALSEAAATRRLLDALPPGSDTTLECDPRSPAELVCWLIGEVEARAPCRLWLAQGVADAQPLEARR